MYKRITRNSTILIITIGDDNDGQVLCTEKEISVVPLSFSIAQTTRRKHTRAIQIEVMNETCPWNNGMDGISISSFIFYVSVRSDNCFA